MRAPRLGDDFTEITIAEDQEEYMPITVVPITFSNGVRGMCSRWAFTDDERARIAAGDDLFVTLLTFGQPMQPIQMSVGRPEWAPERSTDDV